MNDRILEGALNVFKLKGPKFTMDDIATEMKMSKKTIYTVFTDKNELMCEMVDYAFDMIKRDEDVIFKNDAMSTVEKIRAVLAVIPESQYGFDFGAMAQLAEKYPKAYEKLTVRLETGWEKTFDLLRKGVEEGFVRDVDFEIFKLTYEASVERLLMSDFLDKHEIEYPQALAGIVDILVDGIVIKG